MDHDEIIDEVRALREAYAEQFGFDVDALYRDVKERERKGGRKIVSLEPRPVEVAVVGSDPSPLRSGSQT
jgi:hypothetical protein